MGFPVIFHLSLKPIHWSCWWRFCHHSPAMLTSVPAGDPNLARGDDGKHWALGDATRSSLNARETRVKRVSRKSGDVWCCRLFCNRRNRAKLNQRKLPRRHTGWSSCGKHCHIKKKKHMSHWTQVSSGKMVPKKSGTRDWVCWPKRGFQL